MENNQNTNPVETTPVVGEPETNATVVCSNCGTPLGEDQEFCPKCGTPKKKKPVCGKCGAELAEGQVFCPKCGQKVGLAVDANVSSAISQFNAGVSKQNEKKKKTPIIVAVAAIIIVLLAVAGVKVAPKIFVSYDTYMAQGNYEKAYSKAKGDEKADVIAENNIAVCSNMAIDSLKDSKSFDLRDAWYDAENRRVVLQVAANNSYGNTVLNYWLFTYDAEEDQEWEVWDAYSDLNEEESSIYDDTDDFIEKFVNNIGKGYIQDTMVSKNKLSKDGVKRINALFAEDILDSVELFDDAVPNIESSESSSESSN